MGLETVSNTIRSRMSAQFPSEIIAWDNAPVNDKPGDARWVRVSLLWGESFQASIGATVRWRTPGILACGIFVPIESGTKDTDTLIDSLNGIFRGVTVSGITFNAPRMNPIGRSENWHQINVDYPMYYDDVAGTHVVIESGNFWIGDFWK